MWLATQVVPQLQAPLSLLLGYLGVAIVSTLLEANKLARRALVWAQTPLRTFLGDEPVCGDVATGGVANIAHPHVQTQT